MMSYFSGEILKCAYDGLYYPMKPQKIYECQWSDATNAGRSHDNDNTFMLYKTY